MMFFPSPLYHGNTLYLSIAFVSLVDFQNACKLTSRPNGIAGDQEPKKQNYTTETEK